MFSCHVVRNFSGDIQLAEKRGREQEVGISADSGSTQLEAPGMAVSMIPYLDVYEARFDGTDSGSDCLSPEVVRSVEDAIPKPGNSCVRRVFGDV